MKQLSILTLLLALCWSCTSDYDDDSSPYQSKFSVAEARKYFENSNTQVADLTFPSTRSVPSVLTPDWGGAKITTTDDITTVETPLSDGELQAVTVVQTTPSGVSSVKLKTFKRLVTQYHKDGAIRQFVVTMAHAAESRSVQENNCYGKSDFSGYILVSLVDGEYQDAFESDGGLWTRQRVATQDPAAEDMTLEFSPYGSWVDDGPAPQGFIECVTCEANIPVDSECCGSCGTWLGDDIDGVPAPGWAPECAECRRKVYECVCCKYCHQHPCKCGWDHGCHRCGSPYCNGSCGGGGDGGGGSGSEGTNPSGPIPNTPDYTISKLLNILTNDKIKNLLKTKIIPIVIKTQTPIMRSHLKEEWISINPDFYNRFNQQGQQMIFFHEYLHWFLWYDNKPYSNSVFLNSPIYLQGIRDIYPGQSEEFYNNMRWSGCTDTPEFKSKDYFDCFYIESWLQFTLESK